MIDLKGELANSKAGQAAIKQAVDTAAKEHGASIAREKSLKVYAGPACCLCITPNCPESLMPCYAIFLDHLHLQRFLPQTCGLHVMQGVVSSASVSQVCSRPHMAQPCSSCLSELVHRLQGARFCANTNAACQDDARQLQSLLDRARSQHDSLQRQVMDQTNELDSLRGSLTSTRQQLAASEQELDRVKAELRIQSGNFQDMQVERELTQLEVSKWS